MQQLPLEALVAESDSLGRKIERLRKALTEAEHTHDAMQVVIKHFSDQSQNVVQPNLDSGIDPEHLRGMDLGSALIHIAEHNNGQLRSTTARKLLEASEILTGPHSANAIWTFLQSSERFEKVARGRYRLVDAEGD
ncbi:MAG: hypothetical protein OXN89_13415 [Bryobacterales bacterium]|nr:hypothetical protein [Bryobacterales bacterium]